MIDEEETRRKAKRRKRMDQPCDMSTGWHEDMSGHPVVDMCPNRPTRFFPEFGHFGTYLCDTHFETMLASVLRN